MMRFYFDVHDGQGMHRDETGLELADLDAATAEARRALAEMTKDAVAAEDGSEFRITIRDAAGGDLGTISITAPQPEQIDPPA